MIVGGGVLAGVSYQRWRRNERALRLGEPLGYGPAPAAVAALIAVLAVAAAVIAATSSS